jgi:hypothetical protein
MTEKRYGNWCSLDEGVISISSLFCKNPIFRIQSTVVCVRRVRLKLEDLVVPCLIEEELSYMGYRSSVRDESAICFL